MGCASGAKVTEEAEQMNVRGWRQQEFLDINRTGFNAATLVANRCAGLMVEVLSHKKDQAGDERDDGGHSGQFDHLPHFRTPLIIHPLGDL
jgi:hypothetical protein